ncbi:MAG: L,D-transpeptidase family protein [Firmicutes bacterium]|nr:L,D-transpeptidase family protein [Bacillota bacterium]
MPRNTSIYKTSGSILKIFSAIIVLGAGAFVAVAVLTKHNSSTTNRLQTATQASRTSGNLVTATTLTNTGRPKAKKNSSVSKAIEPHNSSTQKQKKPSGTLGSNKLYVVSVTPRQGSVNISPMTQIAITFSQPLASNSPTPSLTPSTPGSWQIVGNKAIFTPTVPFIPLSDITVSVKNGLSPIVSSTGNTLSSAYTSAFKIKTGSVLRIQELLSLLKYSPLSFSSSGTSVSPTDTAAQIEAFYNPPKGKFTWNQTTWPENLTQLWQPNTYNVMTRGLVMEFQADHALLVNGKETAGLFNDLLQAVTNNDINTGGYNYAFVNKTPPESLTVYHNGQVVIKTEANTGIASDPTSDGTYPVFAKYRYQVMHGTNPDGTHYSDPVQFVSYFNGGQAVHYMPRAYYGIPQSLGCVELPLSSASQVWPWLAYGTLVTIIN